jgi:hypothetical protein
MARIHKQLRHPGRRQPTRLWCIEHRHLEPVNDRSHGFGTVILLHTSTATVVTATATHGSGNGNGDGCCTAIGIGNSRCSRRATVVVATCATATRATVTAFTATIALDATAAISTAAAAAAAATATATAAATTSARATAIIDQLVSDNVLYFGSSHDLASLHQQQTVDSDEESGERARIPPFERAGPVSTSQPEHRGLMHA